MINPNLLIIILAVCILIWQIILSLFFWQILNKYKKLVKLEKDEIERSLIAKLEKRITELEQKGLEHIQKIKVVRFNPFNETGGDNSFTLSILNAKMNGVVLTGLHTREKTRMYVKEIKEGKSIYELSKEERQSLNE
jgi:hypothetical protein